MRYRKLDSDDDYSFGNGQLDFWINVPDAVGQQVKTRLLLWLGEWYLDITEGTPYIQGILGKHSLQQADTTVQQRVLDSVDEQGNPTVTDLASYTSQLDGNSRAMSVEMELDTIYGPTPVQIANAALF